ncbi:MCE family protein [Streptomyces sp. A7024]|uniref:MCE family protein n=1 Tax=Streptomyces coryli TaxID=1128680 RepID=A0A6G4U131_9ACTN|nr:MCE family protein [Streptomyces coryli]NGN65969.1 MCE family protein [Streptomyces coryli]
MATTKLRPNERTVRRRRRIAGVVYLLAPALLIWLSLAVYDKEFRDSDTVIVETATVGSEMNPHADVKLRGVVIGEVTKIDTDGEKSRLTLELQPGKMTRIPADVSAQLLPTTLFGQRFVSLVPPSTQAATQTLAAGAVIPQNRSRNAVELEEALDNLLPLLTAVQPEKLSATLSALSSAFEGRGEKIGKAMTTLDGYLKEFNPNLPELNEDIKQLVKVSDTYSKAAPDIVDALHDATTTSATLAAQRAELSTLYASVTASSQDLDTWMKQNSSNLIRLSGTARPTMEILGRYAPAFPCTLATVADFVPRMDAALGKGTDQHGLRVDVNVVKDRGEYLPGRDAPSYGAGGGPRCYPAGGGTGARSASASAPAAASANTFTTSANDLGVANSPQENQLVNELVAAETKSGPDELPDWSSVLSGPAYRGAEVKLN